MEQQINKIKNEVQEMLKNISNAEELEILQNNFLGRKGQIAELMKGIINLEGGARKKAGMAVNQLKQELNKIISEKEIEFQQKKEAERAEKEWLDVTETGAWPKEGHLHPVSIAFKEITEVFSRLGFNRVRAPEIEWDYYAFESLNIPPDHPARDNWETFFIASGAQKAQGDGEKEGKMVLIPHTSNSQVREMEKGKMPIRMININRNYRRQTDVSHSSMFHQFEGLMIDEGLNITHLKGVLNYFVQAYFGADRKIRLRPHHFRFTEPSFEIDISCGVCHGNTDPNSECRLCKSGWVELGGAGMVHPNVLKAGGLDPEKYSGFAFGWGVERTLMMREGMQIDDIRLLYRNDLNFIKQF